MNLMALFLCCFVCGFNYNPSVHSERVLEVEKPIQRAVSDLTNTTWVFNDSDLQAYETAFHINFTSNDVSYTVLDFIVPRNLRIYYNQTEVFNYSWSLQAYRTITITGGDDVNNADLISYLEDNATQQISVDLTNTTWYFNQSLNLISFDYEITFINIRSDVTYTYNRLYCFANFNNPSYSYLSYFGFSGGGNDRIRFLLDNLSPTIVAYDSNMWIDNSYRTISITGGVDVTNSNLYNWLSSNAVQQGSIPSVDLSNTSWSFNDYLELPLFEYPSTLYSVNFFDYQLNSYSAFRLQVDTNYTNLRYIKYDNEVVYTYNATTGNGAWSNVNYQHISFLNGLDITSYDLYTFVTTYSIEVDDDEESGDSSTSITNLYNSSWTFNNTIPLSPRGYNMNQNLHQFYESYDVDFYSNTESFYGLDIGNSQNALGGLYYTYQSDGGIMIAQRYYTYPNDWLNSSYKNIVFTGNGSDLTNQILIRWLINNATFNGFLTDSSINNLTNTLWLFNNSFDSYLNLRGSTINGDLYFNDDYHGEMFQYWNFNEVEGVTSLTYYATNQSYYEVWDSDNGWTTESSRMITINGGSLANNVDVINWLYANATFLGYTAQQYSTFTIYNEMSNSYSPIYIPTSCVYFNDYLNDNYISNKFLGVYSTGGNNYVSMTITGNSVLSVLYYGNNAVETTDRIRFNDVYRVSFLPVASNEINDAYQTGFYDGYQQSNADGGAALTIFEGILSVGLMPINFFLSVMNFEIFGINISGLVTGLLTVAMVIIIVRLIFGGSSGGKNND